MRYLATSANVFFIIGLLAACRNKDSDPLPPAPPIASFTGLGPFGVGDSTRFTNTSTNATSYTWDFGDGTMATGIAPAHVYKQVGKYVVKLEVANSDGSNSQTNTFSISLPPAGAKCTCTGITFSRTVPETQLPERVFEIGDYGTDGMSMDGKNYELVSVSNNAASSSYRATVYSASMGAQATFVKATGILDVSSWSGGIGNPTYVQYHCKRQR